MEQIQKTIQTKLAKGLLDIIVLEFLDAQPMHGYQIMTKIRQNFGVYFGPSTIYPLLNDLEKKGYIKENISFNGTKPRKTYTLTRDGQIILNFAEETLIIITQKIVHKISQLST